MYHKYRIYHIQGVFIEEFYSRGLSKALI